MGVKRKTANNKNIKPQALNGFFSGFFDLLRPDGAVLRPDADRNPFCFAVFVNILTGRLNILPGIGIQLFKLTNGLIIV
jgi:hypothetical protein